MHHMSESHAISAPDQSPPFVLIHGAWHGAWCWERVAPLLRAAGHEVLAPCCPGVGERAGELDAGLGLERMIADTGEAILAADLRAIVLVGHSFGGWVIAGIADRIGDRIAQLVFLDANLVRDGSCPFDTLSAETVAARRAAAAQGPGGLGMPAPAASAFGISDAADAAWVESRLTPHPLKSYEDRLRLVHPLGNGKPMTYVACMDPPFPAAAPAREWASAQADWNYVEIASGHDAMVIAPDLLARTLMAIASSAARAGSPAVR